MAYIFPKIEFINGNVIRVHNPEPIGPATNLTANVAATGTTLTVANNEKFANNDILLIGSFGDSDAEITDITAAVSAGTSLTVSALIFAHNYDDQIRILLADQIEISGAATITGSKTTIATVEITASEKWTDYIVSGTTYAYYFVRFYNSFASTPYYSDYSDAIAATGYDTNTVGWCRRLAFKELGLEYNAEMSKFDSNTIYDWIYECELDISKSLKRWSWLQQFDYDLGNLTEGQYSVAVPTDLDDQNTSKSILGIHLGKDINLDYIDRSQFIFEYRDIGHTTVSSSITAADTSITLTDVRDFNSSGSIDIADDKGITYTAKNNSTGVLSGIPASGTGSIGSNHSAAVDVWQGVTFNVPRRYAIWEGYIYFDHPIDSSLEGYNIWLDYYKKITRKNSDGDTLTIPDQIAVISYLKYKIKEAMNNGVLSMDDPSYQKYLLKKNELINNEISGQNVYFVPEYDSSN